MVGWKHEILLNRSLDTLNSGETIPWLSPSVYAVKTKENISSSPILLSVFVLQFPSHHVGVML